MNRSGLLTLLTLSLSACPSGPDADGGTGGGLGGGAGGGTGLSPFVISELDGTARDTLDFAATFDATAERVGVAYFTPAGTFSHVGLDGGNGVPDYHLKYVEWNQGTVSTPEVVATVQNLVGVSVAFDPANGEPLVGFLGGPTDLDVSIFWFQHNAVLARRTGGTWTETVVAESSSDVDCGNPVSNAGDVVGVFPAMTFTADGTFFFAYRDIHNGQFPKQDWEASDVELREGPGAPPTGARTCVAQGGDGKPGWGGHLQMILGAGGQPAISHDQMPNAAGTSGRNVAFQERNTDGTWTAPFALYTVSNTQSGPSLAWDDQEGYGIAVIDRTANQLQYLRRPAGSTTWNSPDPVYGAGSGGWYPSVAMDPTHHEPVIAFYKCSARTGVTDTGCEAREDSLVLRQRIANEWRESLVDEAGGYTPKLSFFASGKKVLVYRQPAALDAQGNHVSNVGTVKIAVER